MRCEFKTIEPNLITCIRCGRDLNVSVDPSTVKRTCETSKDGLIRYAVWHGLVRGWEFVWLKPGMDLEPDKYEECPVDRSQVGTKLATLITVAGYKVDMDTCYCKALQAQLDAANLRLITKHKARFIELIQKSSKKAGVDVSEAKIKLALWSVIKAEQIRCLVR